jgi:hypothetical protein
MNCLQKATRAAGFLTAAAGTPDAIDNERQAPDSGRLATDATT